MTFKEIQDAVIADRFAPGQRADVQKWVNHEYGKLWDLEPWTFVVATALVTVTANSRLVTNLPADLATPLGLVNSNGDRLTALEAATYDERYYGTGGATQTGMPEAYTMVGSVMKVGPISNETRSDYELTYERGPTMLASDNDVPSLPAEFHFSLVYAAAAVGLALQSDPSWTAFKQFFEDDVTAMRKAFLGTTHDRQGQWAAYRP